MSYGSTEAYAQRIEDEERLAGIEANVEGLFTALDKLAEIEKRQNDLLASLVSDIKEALYRVQMVEGIAPQITELRAKIR